LLVSEGESSASADSDNLMKGNSAPLHIEYMLCPLRASCNNEINHMLCGCKESCPYAVLFYNLGYIIGNLFFCIGQGPNPLRPQRYTRSEAWSEVDWANLIPAQGAFGTDFYDRSTRTIVGTML